MKKQILNLGKTLNKVQQKAVKGGGIPCFEWCALDPIAQSFVWKPVPCSCYNGGGSGSGNPSGGGNGNGPVDPV